MSLSDLRVLIDAMRRQMIMDIDDKKYRRANMLHDAIMALHELEECKELRNDYK